MMNVVFLVTVLIALLGLGGMAQADVLLETASIGGVGTAVETLISCSSVGCAYRIGKYDVMNAHYLSFLNGVGEATIMSDLWNKRGWITSTSAMATKYGVADSLPGAENNPVIFVSWYDTMRFANSRLMAWAQAARSRAAAQSFSRLPFRG